MKHTSVSSMLAQQQLKSLFHRSVHSRLGAIHGIKGLVQEQSNGPAVVDPAGTVLVEAWIVPQQRQEVDDDKREAGESDGIGRHRHGKTLDDHIGIEGLQDVFGR